MKEYDHVLIKNTGIKGIIVDIAHINGRMDITIESDERLEKNGAYSLISCSPDEIIVSPE